MIRTRRRRTDRVDTQVLTKLTSPPMFTHRNRLLMHLTSSQTLDRPYNH